MRKANKSKSKADRRKWWFSLSPEKQFNYIENIGKARAIKRREKSIQVMKQYKGQFSCSDCFHGKLECCTDRLPNGCEYWYNPNVPWSLQGLKIRETGNRAKKRVPKSQTTATRKPIAGGRQPSFREESQNFSGVSLRDGQIRQKGERISGLRNTTFTPPVCSDITYQIIAL